MADVIDINVPDRIERIARHHFGMCEVSMATILDALTRVSYLTPLWREEFQSDVKLLRQKLREISDVIDPGNEAL